MWIRKYFFQIRIRVTEILNCGSGRLIYYGSRRIQILDIFVANEKKCLSDRYRSKSLNVKLLNFP
jgi:hypothetical protein